MCVAACQCSAEGSRYTSCDQVTGHCVCLPHVVGQRCDSCAHGAYGFPNCQSNHTHTHSNTQNDTQTTMPLTTEWWSDLHFLFTCEAGTCHPAGSVQYVVTPPLVSTPLNISFTFNKGKISNIALQWSSIDIKNVRQIDELFYFVIQGQCECRQHVEGPACDRCKPLYWNLSPDSPDGCTSEIYFKHNNMCLHCAPESLQYNI